MRSLAVVALNLFALGSLLADGDPDSAPYFISSSYAAFTVGSPGNTFTVDVGGSPTPSIYIYDGTLNSGGSLVDNHDGTATLSGVNPGDGGSYPLTLRAENGVNPDAEQSFYLEIFERTTITSADHATFTVGEPGAFSVTTSGGYPDPTSVTLAGDPLPAGLTYTNNGNSGSLQGTPGEGTDGTYNLQFVGHNDAGDTTQNFTLTVAPPLPASPCIPRPAGLIGWWTGDGTAIDIQNDNNGTLQGGTTFEPGKVGRGFNFDGTTGYIAIGNPGTLKARAVTIEAWVKPTALPANGATVAIATKWSSNPAKNASGDAYGLYLINDNGTLRVRAQVNPTFGDELTLQGGSVPLNHFAHVAMTYENLTGIFAVYVNGVAVNQADPGHSINASDVNVMIGREANNTTPRFFTGIIDEVSIYNRALDVRPLVGPLNGNEIPDLYHAKENGKCKTSACTNPPVNLLAWLSADNTAVDIQGDRIGLMQGGATFASGKVGQAFDLLPSNNGIEIPADPAWDFGVDEFTIATWIRFQAQDSYQIIASHEQSGGVPGGWRFLFNGFNLQFQGKASFSVGIPDIVPAMQQWYHLVVTRSGSTYKFYIDGQQVGADQTNSTAIAPVNGPLFLGYSEGFPLNHGRIDEFQIVHRALSAAEIAAIYNAGNTGQCKSFTMYVTNPGNGTVTQLDADGDSTPFASGLSTPLGIALDRRGNIYVANNGANNVMKFDIDGNGAPFAAALDPHGVAFDGTGNLYVASSSGDAIQTFDSSGASLGALPGGAAALDQPLGLTIDDNGNLFVTNNGNNSLSKFDLQASWSVASVSPLLVGPAGLRFDNNGNALVANPAANSIVALDATGVGATFAGSGTGLNGVHDVVVDSNGNVFATNTNANTILKFAPSGAVSTFATLASGSQPSFIVLRQRSPLIPIVKVGAASRMADGHVVLGGQSLPNALVTIRATADLSTEPATIGSTTADNTGAYQYNDAGAVGAQKRFYTAHW